MSDKSIRVGVTLSGDVAKAFDREIKRTLATNAAFARLLIIEGLRSRGYELKDDVSWGGFRERKESEPGQYEVAGTA